MKRIAQQNNTLPWPKYLIIVKNFVIEKVDFPCYAYEEVYILSQMLE